MKELTAREARLYGRMHVADNGCWEWTGARNRGYGVTWNGQRTRLVHREAWLEWRGPIPDSMSVLHHCDNPPCFNPEHLFIGTHTDNMRDAAAKGRMGSQVHPERRPRGERHHAARLTETHVIRIRERRAAGEPLALLAAEFGVSQANISRIALRRNWRHV